MLKINSKFLLSFRKITGNAEQICLVVSWTLLQAYEPQIVDPHG